MILLALVLGFAIPQPDAPVEIKACSARRSDAHHIEFRMQYESRSAGIDNAVVNIGMYNAAKSRALGEASFLVALHSKSGTIVRKFVSEVGESAFYFVPLAFDCMISSATFSSGQAWSRPAVQYDYYGHENWFSL